MGKNQCNFIRYKGEDRNVKSIHYSKVKYGRGAAWIVKFVFELGWKLESTQQSYAWSGRYSLRSLVHREGFNSESWRWFFCTLISRSIYFKEEEQERRGLKGSPSHHEKEISVNYGDFQCGPSFRGGLCEGWWKYTVNIYVPKTIFIGKDMLCSPSQSCRLGAICPLLLPLSAASLKSSFRSVCSGAALAALTCRMTNNVVLPWSFTTGEAQAVHNPGPEDRIGEDAPRYWQELALALGALGSSVHRGLGHALERGSEKAL